METQSVIESTTPVVEEKPLVFLIDDDEDLLILVEKALKNDFRTKTIIDPLEVIQAAEEIAPTCMILDLQMPNIDGYEALKMFREHPFTSSIPIICMSSDFSQQIRSHLDSLGANGFIKKPIKAELLSRTIKNILRSLNQTVKSKRGNYNCTIAFNDLEKNKLLLSEAKSLL